jgi:hypothetical protein
MPMQPSSVVDLSRTDTIMCSCYAIEASLLDAFSENDEYALEYALDEHELQVNQVGAEVKLVDLIDVCSRSS